MKRRRMVTGFLHTFGIQACLIALHPRELYMAIFAIEYRISHYSKQPDTSNWDQVMDHFLKVCKEFA